jgi:Mg-chelatase subunit ChlD
LKEIDTPATTERVERKKIDRGAASGLKAGFADDNKQFNYYVHFLGQFGKQVRHYAINIEERIILRVKDKDGRSLPNAKVKISADGKDLCAGKTYADGSFFFFPSEYDKKYKKYTAVISSMQKEKEVTIDRRGKREIPVTFDAPRSDLKNIPLDILFIFDTTGSMGEEINRLKSTIEIINMNLASLSSKPKIRFGLVLYRDRGDDYVTKVVPLTADLDVFQKELEKVSAGGGGDTPEDLQTALHDAMKKIKWNKEGVRLSFIITDAPPHLDYEQEYTYVNAARDARREAIKIFTVGSGGLDLMGEFVLRQISQYTYAK